ncbi:HK97 gp10 family phage protein [Pseudoduganella sp. FT26W]|uniref:HK97 gp10 family phage protein n=1 Tax=Duganella aquatilis TaxID=2666082 RepID=A0A844D425_9BURK|nr:HK97 gp10 family phage protein [Duganella aquatilis]MRW82886.1 HK97 gp10 family phage protein [Duganella aquatilis]
MAGSFSADISKFITKAGSNVDKAVRQTVVLAGQGVVMTTPVLTGRLRANWQFGVNMPAGVLDSVDVAGAATIAKMAGQVTSLKAGGECWIVNNLPYAGEIEYGHSSVKAPAGMVRVTLAGLPAAIEQYVRGLQ